MANPGDHEDVPHTLIPLGLAVGLIRSKVYAEGKSTDRDTGHTVDLNALASFVAATVPVYEYESNPSKAPRALGKAELEGGMFRDGAKELRFIDGRATKRYLALNALDVECVTSLLREPEHAVRIRSRYVRMRAQKLRTRATWLRNRASALRNEAVDLRSSDDERLPNSAHSEALLCGDVPNHEPD
jgi:hypothetical protein